MRYCLFQAHWSISPIQLPYGTGWYYFVLPSYYRQETVVIKVKPLTWGFKVYRWSLLGEEFTQEGRIVGKIFFVNQFSFSKPEWYLLCLLGFIMTANHAEPSLCTFLIFVIFKSWLWPVLCQIALKDNIKWEIKKNRSGICIGSVYITQFWVVIHEETEVGIFHGYYVKILTTNKTLSNIIQNGIFKYLCPAGSQL